MPHSRLIHTPLTPGPKDEKRENRFVFIGRDLNKQKLLDGFNACQCSETLRFAIGDSVKARGDL